MAVELEHLGDDLTHLLLVIDHEDADLVGRIAILRFGDTIGLAGLGAGQADGEGGPFTGFALQGDGAAMGHHDTMAKR